MTTGADTDLDEGAAGEPTAATPTDDPARNRAGGGTLPVVGMVVAIAVLAATAIVLWARMPAGAPQAVSAQDVPGTLGDGRPVPPTPDALAGAIGLPVVMAERRDDPGEIANGCEMDPGTVLSAHITPDQATVLARTDDPPMNADIMADPETNGPLNVACISRWRGGTWQRMGLSAVPARGPESRFPAWMCCDADGNSVVYHVLEVHPDAAWLLEDKGHYALAYDVAGLNVAGVAGEVLSPDGMGSTAHVWWVDGRGVIAGEAYRGS